MSQQTESARVAAQLGVTGDIVGGFAQAYFDPSMSFVTVVVHREEVERSEVVRFSGYAHEMLKLIDDLQRSVKAAQAYSAAYRAEVQDDI